MTLTAGIAGAAVLWQSNGDAVRQTVAKTVQPLIVTLLSLRESSAVDQPSAAPAVEAAAVPAGPAASVSPSTGGGSIAPSTQPSLASEHAELLQSIARDLANLRHDMEQMKASVAELKSSQDQMAREIVKVSDRATDKALEQALRPRVSMVPPQPAQPVAMAARKPAPTIVRPVQTRAVSVSPQAAAYVPRQAEPRAVAPPQAAAAPPMDLSAPRPPSPLREQVP